MPELTRRGFLQAAGLSACALGTSALLDGCTTSTVGSSAPSGARTAVSPPLPVFRPGGRAAKTGLPRRVAWADTSDTEIFVALGQGVQRAAGHRGLDYVTAQAGGDPAKNVDELNTFLGEGVGALVVQPLDQAAQNPVVQRAIDSGVCVEGIITYPSTMQVAARQYDIGHRQGIDAVRYAQQHLGGTADVSYFNQDAISPQLALRHRGFLDALKTGGRGIRLLSDVDLPGATIDDGFIKMLTVIQRYPTLKLVMGTDDTPVVGAFRALQQVGKLTDDMYLSGTDGDTNALALVAAGGPYRVSYAFPWGLMGYTMGQIAADWIEGKQVPRVLVAETVTVNSPAMVRAYQSINATPEQVYADAAQLRHYLPMLGNVSHANRTSVWEQEYVP